MIIIFEGQAVGHADSREVDPGLHQGPVVRRRAATLTGLHSGKGVIQVPIDYVYIYI